MLALCCLHGADIDLSNSNLVRVPPVGSEQLPLDTTSLNLRCVTPGRVVLFVVVVVAAAAAALRAAAKLIVNVCTTANSNNKLITLPARLGELTVLDELDVSHNNGLSVIEPRALANSLTKFACSGCPVSSLPDRLPPGLQEVRACCLHGVSVVLLEPLLLSHTVHEALMDSFNWSKLTLKCSHQRLHH